MPSLFPQFFVFSFLIPLILRIILGIILIIHGYPKLFKNFSNTVVWFNDAGLKPAKFWVLTIGILEFFGGISLIFGFLTQLIAILLSIQFLFIILWIKRGQKLVGGYEFDLTLFAISFSLIFLGAGAYAIDLPI